jgi:hypothetical protein
VWGRAQLGSILPLLLAGVALLSAAWQLPRSLRDTERRVDRNAGLTPLQRELAPAGAYGAHEDLAVHAEKVIPRDASFAVVTGGQPGSDAAVHFYAYWLLPRRASPELSAAQWVITFGADPHQLAVGVDVVDDLGGGAAVGRVKR